jgi:hypothetical protein
MPLNEGDALAPARDDAWAGASLSDRRWPTARFARPGTQSPRRHQVAGTPNTSWCAPRRCLTIATSVGWLKPRFV